MYDPQILHVILKALIDDLPILILEFLPGIINFLQFLQKRIWYSNGIFTLYLNIIFLAVDNMIIDK